MPAFDSLSATAAELTKSATAAELTKTDAANTVQANLPGIAARCRAHLRRSVYPRFIVIGTVIGVVIGAVIGMVIGAVIGMVVGMVVGTVIGTDICCVFGREAIGLV